MPKVPAKVSSSLLANLERDPGIERGVNREIVLLPDDGADGLAKHTVRHGVAHAGQVDEARARVDVDIGRVLSPNQRVFWFALFWTTVQEFRSCEPVDEIVS